MNISEVDHALPNPSECPNCGHLLECCSACGRDLRETERPPGPGDIYVCMECGKVLEFQYDGSLAAIPISAVTPDLRMVIRQVQKVVRDNKSE